MAGQNPGFTPLGYAGNTTDAPRTAQAYQDDRSRYLNEANKPIGLRAPITIAAGPAAQNVELEHNIGRVPSFAVPGIEADLISLGDLVIAIQERNERSVIVRVASNLPVVTDAEIVVVILP